jgi:hypothetical protein
VVGIIATLLLLLARVVILPGGPGGGVRWAALALAVGVWLALERGRLEMHWALVIAALAGLALQAAGLA